MKFTKSEFDVLKYAFYSDCVVSDDSGVYEELESRGLICYYDAVYWISDIALALVQNDKIMETIVETD